MSALIQTIQQCVFKSPVPQSGVITEEDPDSGGETVKADDIKESETVQTQCDKKTDEVPDQGSKSGLLWKMSSGLYNTATGAVGYGVGSVKWVAGKTYDVGSSVVSHVKVPSVSTLRRKDKKE
ncbi:transmembrane protein 263-like [Saccostrea echinata]|uniref:transmembrane protein 263-like n=1 Tax=Saccostrea echinata TaxID=191078 RepID=UPI002A7F58CD|nr:transmembrane protein 263-like [Saccostrea echinata]